MSLTMAELEKFDEEHPDLAEHPELVLGVSGACIGGFFESIEAAYQHIYGSSTDGGDGCPWCQAALKRQFELLEMYQGH